MSIRMKRFVLIGSLLLNVFFISWAGSQWLKTRFTSDSLLARTIQTVPEAARPVFLKHLRNNKKELLRGLQQFMGGRQVVSRLSQQTELDSAELEQALTQARVGLNSTITQLQSAMLAAMKEMPPEVKQEWVQQWVQQRPLKNVQLTRAIEGLARELEK